MAAKLLFAGLLALAFALVSIQVLRPYLRSSRLRRIRQQPPPASWDVLLRRYMPGYTAIAPPIRQRLLGQMQVFLHEKHFVGCAGLTITDEMKVIVAAWACLMSLNSRIPYPELQSILIYPDAFLVDKRSTDEAGVVSVGRTALIGESWERHKVILSWADIEDSFADSGSGRDNVIVHEFAHQLDALDGAMGGSPPLASAADHKVWADVFAEEYDRLLARLQRHHTDSVIRPYGATNPAEFFAVVAEAFFQNPHKLRGEHPELYKTLSRYFVLDPCEWMPEQRSRRH